MIALERQKHSFNGPGINNPRADTLPRIEIKRKGIRAVGGVIATLFALQASAVAIERKPRANKNTAIMVSSGIYYRSIEQQIARVPDSPPPALITTSPQPEIPPESKQVGSQECNDGWEELRESVCFTKFREYDSDIYVVRVDLTDPHISVRPSFAAEPGRLGRLNDGAQKQGAIAAINASFFRGTRPLGPIAVDGSWLHTDPSPQQVLIVNNDNTVHLVPTKQALKEDPAQMKFALSGSHTLIQNGISTSDFGPDNAGRVLYSAQPRTAIGVDAEGHLYMIVVDGRSRKSRGLKMPELETVMYGLGAHNAIALDGGRSAGFYAKGGMLNTPSKGPTNISTILGVYAK